MIFDWAGFVFVFLCLQFCFIKTPQTFFDRIFYQFGPLGVCAYFFFCLIFSLLLLRFILELIYLFFPLELRKKRPVFSIAYHLFYNAIFLILVLFIGLHFSKCVVDKSGGQGMTYLHLSVIANNLSLSSIFLRLGFDPNCKDKKHNTPLTYSLFKNYKKMVKLLLENGASPNVIHPDYGTALQQEALVGNLINVKMLVENGAELNFVLPGRNLTPLHLACINPAGVEIAGYLIEKGSKIDFQGDGGYTPLHWAVKRGNIETVKMLLKKGCSLKLKDVTDRTAADLAFESGNNELIKIFSVLTGKNK
ncbi:ankyrin repeat domain-containing protein [Candidatus Riflebacteria bacterium]